MVYLCKVLKVTTFNSIISIIIIEYGMKISVFSVTVVSISDSSQKTRDKHKILFL